MVRPLVEGQKLTPGKSITRRSSSSLVQGASRRCPNMTATSIHPVPHPQCVLCMLYISHNLKLVENETKITRSQYHKGATECISLPNAPAATASHTRASNSIVEKRKRSVESETDVECCESEESIG